MNIADILSSPPPASDEAVKSWLGAFMKGGSEPKLMFVGPNMNYRLTGRITPLRGNAHQRRRRKRFFKRQYDLDYDNLPRTIGEIFPQ